ncbi:MAG: SDR family oxidoreductase [Gemmatimonadota bacterium]
MTVLVTGASGLLGRAIVAALVERDEVRATVRREDASEDLRALGAKVAVRAVWGPDDVLEILPRVHTIVHLTGGVNQPSDEAVLEANHASTLAVVAAARGSRVQRLILLSAPGAAPDHSHPFLRAKGLAEEAVVHSGLEHAVLRCTHAYGLGGLWFTASVVAAEHGLVIGDGRQRLAPVFADDVGAVVAAIDDSRDHVTGVWSLAGPDVVTADELFALLGEGGEPVHLDSRTAAVRLTELLGMPLSAGTADLFAAASVPDGPGATAAFGIRPTPLEEGLRLTVARAAGAAARVPRDG